MINIKFKGQGENGDWFVGMLSISQGCEGQPEEGWYISNSCGMPWAYKVDPQTVEVIRIRKPDSRFDFEKRLCPRVFGQEFRNPDLYLCRGPKCEIWIEDQGCAERMQAEYYKELCGPQKTADETLEGILKNIGSKDKTEEPGLEYCIDPKDLEKILDRKLTVKEYCFVTEVLDLKKGDIIHVTDKYNEVDADYRIIWMEGGACKIRLIKKKT